MSNASEKETIEDVRTPTGDLKSSLHSRSSTAHSSLALSINGSRYKQSSPQDDEILDATLSPHISRASGLDLGKKTTGLSTTSTGTMMPAFEIDWDEDDKENPRNWSLAYRGAIIGYISFATTCIVLYSTSYTAGIPGIMADFGIADETVPVLGVTTYLLGLAVGSIILAPLSEMYGRRPIYLVTQVLFIVMIIPCGLAPNLAAILASRFFGAIAGSALIANSPGTVSDVVEEEYRALAFSIWGIGPMQGPNLGPVIGGFVYEYLGWRWTNWVVMIWAGVALVMLFLIKETYAPTILRERAEKKRKETGDPRWWSRYDEKKSVWEVLKVNLSRPFVMIATEPICMFWDVYVAVLYATLYLCFVAYPIVFAEQRHWSPGFTGLSYLGIGIGVALLIVCEPLCRKLINSHAPDPATGKPPPEAMVSIVCISAVLVPVGELVFAWTCTPNVHWIAPILAGIPFGAGNCGVFIYASNYLVHSYGVYAASALAGNSVFRSALGATLPLAGPSMYRSLGSNWAGTLLGLIELVLVAIPLVFYRYGHKIREKSVWIQKLRADMERLERKRGSAEKSRRRDGNNDGAGNVEEDAGGEDRPMQSMDEVERVIVDKDETKV